jgi:alkaline phosphatase D
MLTFASRPLLCSGVIAILLSATAAAQAQHDYKIARRWIRAGDYNKAIEVTNEQIAKYPDDSEWVYQQAIALAQKGLRAQAQTAVFKAMSLGVPPGRVAAEAHDLLKPLRGLNDFDKVVESQHRLPVQGPMVGSVTDSSARIWLRTAVPAEVKITCRPADGDEQAIAATAETSPESDFTAVILLEGLKPEQDYTYSLSIGGEPVRLFYPATFRTMPEAGSSLKFRFAFGGGAGYVTAHERMWDTIAEFSPDALLLLGDNMYSDDPESPTMQRFCYYRRQSPWQFRRLVAKTAVYSIWDDHDFGDNDCSGGPEIDVPAWKRPVWEVFRQNWVNQCQLVFRLWLRL